MGHHAAGPADAEGDHAEDEEDDDAGDDLDDDDEEGIRAALGDLALEYDAVDARFTQISAMLDALERTKTSLAAEVDLMLVRAGPDGVAPVSPLLPPAAVSTNH